MDWGHSQWLIVPLGMESIGTGPGLLVYKHANEAEPSNLPLRSPFPPNEETLLSKLEQLLLHPNFL